MIATLRALLAIALLASLCLIPAALVFAVLFLLPFLNYIATGSPAPSVYYLIPAMPGLWVLLYIVFMLLGVTGRPRDASAVVGRDEDKGPDGLWGRVDRLAQAAGTRRPVELRLTAEPNAGVVEETRWLGLIAGTRRMYLGIPLLVALPDEQLDAVICHELGHYARGHTRAGVVCYRARVAAELMVSGLAMVRARRDSNRRRNMVNRVVSEAHYQLVCRYAEVYRRLSAATTQSQEFQADAKAAEITRDPQGVADALDAAHAVIAGWEMFTEAEKHLLHLADSTRDPFTEFRDEWKDQGFRWRATQGAAKQVHDPFGTHPPLQERLARLAQAGAAASPAIPAEPPREARKIPLCDNELNRLFYGEADVQRDAKEPPEPARKDPKAILGLLLGALKSRPVAAGAAAVIVLSGTASGVYEGHRHARPYGALVHALAPAANPDNSDGFTLGPSASPLAVKLTGYLQAKNESGFLSLAAPAARKAMQSWWANQQAMGFTTGAVVPASPADNIVNVNSAGDGTTTVLAGTHSPFDPADGALVPPAVPSTEYRIGLHFSPGADEETVGQITSWTPLSDAPWDQGTPLSVLKSAHVEVLGDSRDSDLVSQTLPLAETAATYVLAFISHVDPEPLNDQTGFVVFVSGSASDRNRWFRSGQQPEEQTGDADGGMTHLLQGPSDGYAWSLMGNSNLASADGGGRIVVTPYQQAGETPQEETAVLVREMIHARLMSFAPTDKDIQPWANEGIARVIADLYQANGNPVPASYDFRQMITAIRALPSSYRAGTLPDSQQLYGGTTASRADWDAVAASVYAYIAEKYGISNMLGSADLLGTTIGGPDPLPGPDTPFGHVFEAGKDGKITYLPASAISTGWRKWLQNLS
jgi:Zn-dependent protease with chaperone function